MTPARTRTPVRVIVHAGFHKTGTSSLQDYLLRHRDTLAPAFTYYGQPHFPKAGNAARRYALRRFPWRLWAFRLRLRRFLSSIPDAPLIVISRENLSGATPGQPDWRGRTITAYAPAAIPLARATVAELRRRFGPEVRIEFFYTLRASEPWLRSLYGHHLRGRRLTEDFPGFRARFADGFDLRDEAARLAAALAPVPVHTAALEDYAGARSGPAEALFDLIELDPELRAGLPRALRWNVGQRPAIEAEFLRLNRTVRRSAELTAQKEALARRVRASKGARAENPVPPAPDQP